MQSHLADTCFRKESAKHCSLHGQELEGFQNWHCFIFILKLSILTLLTNIHLSPFLLFIKAGACTHIYTSKRAGKGTELSYVQSYCSEADDCAGGDVLQSWQTSPMGLHTSSRGAHRNLRRLFGSHSFPKSCHSSDWGEDQSWTTITQPALTRQEEPIQMLRLQLLRVSATTLMSLRVQKWAEEQKWDRTHTSTRKNWKESHCCSLLHPGLKKPEASHYKASHYSLSTRLRLVMTQQHWPQHGNFLPNKFPSTEVQGWQGLWC